MMAIQKAALRRTLATKRPMAPRISRTPVAITGTRGLEKIGGSMAVASLVRRKCSATAEINSGSATMMRRATCAPPNWM